MATKIQTWIFVIAAGALLSCSATSAYITGSPIRGCGFPQGGAGRGSRAWWCPLVLRRQGGIPGLLRQGAVSGRGDATPLGSPERGAKAAAVLAAGGDYSAPQDFAEREGEQQGGGQRVEEEEEEEEEQEEEEEEEDLEIARLALAILKVTDRSPNPALPSIGFDFEYLLTNRNMEGEEWSMGDCWTLPTIDLAPGDCVQSAAAELMAKLGFAGENTAVYPNHFADVVYQIRRDGDDTLIWTPQGSFTAGGVGQGVTMDEKLQAELLVVTSPKSKAVKGVGAALRWFDTRAIMDGWTEATSGELTLESPCVDGTFRVLGERIDEGTVEVLARTEMLRERFPASLLCNVEQTQSFFSILALGDLDLSDGDDPDKPAGNGGGGAGGGVQED